LFKDFLNFDGKGNKNLQAHKVPLSNFVERKRGFVGQQDPFFWSWENLSYFETIDFSQVPFFTQGFPILMGKEKGSSQVPSFNFMEKVFYCLLCMKA